MIENDVTLVKRSMVEMVIDDIDYEIKKSSKKIDSFFDNLFK